MSFYNINGTRTHTRTRTCTHNPVQRSQYHVLTGNMIVWGPRATSASYKISFSFYFLKEFLEILLGKQHTQGNRSLIPGLWLLQEILQQDFGKRESKETQKKRQWKSPIDLITQPLLFLELDSQLMVTYGRGRRRKYFKIEFLKTQKGIKDNWETEHKSCFFHGSLFFNQQPKYFKGTCVRPMFWGDEKLMYFPKKWIYPGLLGGSAG